MALINSYLVLAKDIQARVEAAAPALNIKAVFYGDQSRIPITPAVCIEPGTKNRNLNGMPRRTEIEMTVFLIIYHYQLNTPEVIREDNDLLAERLEDVLHLDAQLKNALGEATVIDSLVTSIESGFQQRRNSLFRASRLTFEARSQEQLPYAP